MGVRELVSANRHIYTVKGVGMTVMAKMCVGTGLQACRRLIFREK